MIETLPHTAFLKITKTKIKTHLRGMQEQLQCWLRMTGGQRGDHLYDEVEHLPGRVLRGRLHVFFHVLLALVDSGGEEEGND